MSDSPADPPQSGPGGPGTPPPRKGPLSFLSGAITSVLLGWLSICHNSGALGAVVAVFCATGVGVALWLHKSTRPRFRVPKGMRGGNKPQAYLMGSGAFDPEKGTAVHQGATNPLGHQPRMPGSPGGPSTLTAPLVSGGGGARSVAGY